MGDNQGTKVRKLQAARSRFMKGPLIRIGRGKGTQQSSASNSHWDSVTKRKEDSTPESFNSPPPPNPGGQERSRMGNGGGHLFWPFQSSCFYKITFFFLSLPASWTFSM